MKNIHNIILNIPFFFNTIFKCFDLKFVEIIYLFWIESFFFLRICMDERVSRRSEKGKK